jgi:hypothetical protein
MNKFYKSIGMSVVGLLVIALFALITGVFVMLLWNWLMPMLFNLQTINFWEGWGISCLCGFLFKGTTTTNNKE